MPRLPLRTASPLLGLLLLTACGSPDPSPGAPAESSAPATTAASTPSSAATASETTSETTDVAPTAAEVSTDPSGDEPTASEAVSVPDGDLGPALDAILPGLGAAGDGPLTEVCGQLAIGSERWLVETVAAGEYAPYAPDGFIGPEDATRIVDVIEPRCG